MTEKYYTLFCDESCHLQYDKSNVMCIGGIVVPDNKIYEYKETIKSIKKKYGILQELKWNTVSATHIGLYKDLIQFFFNSDIYFSSILVRNKSEILAQSLDRDEYNQFYFSIIERLILLTVNNISENNSTFRVFLDLKDSHGAKKLNSVSNAVTVNISNENRIAYIQNIRSHESVFIQLADILLGAITYRARCLNSSFAKKTIVELIEHLSGHTLNEKTEPKDNKFSIYDFQPRRND